MFLKKLFLYKATRYRDFFFVAGNVLIWKRKTSNNFFLHSLMTLSKLAIICVFLCSAAIALGQENFYCKLDTFEIVTNQHLDNFLYKLRFDSFKEYRKTEAIPPFIKESLDCLTGGDFSLCNPGQKFINSCTSSRNLPQRQLQYLCISKNMFVMIYLRGTIALETRIILITFYGETILDMWAGYDNDGKTRNKNQLINVLNKKRNKIVDFGFL